MGLRTMGAQGREEMRKPRSSDAVSSQGVKRCLRGACLHCGNVPRAPQRIWEVHTGCNWPLIPSTQGPASQFHTGPLPSPTPPLHRTLPPTDLLQDSVQERMPCQEPAPPSCLLSLSRRDSRSPGLGKSRQRRSHPTTGLLGTPSAKKMADCSALWARAKPQPSPLSSFHSDMTLQPGITERGLWGR